MRAACLLLAAGCLALRHGWLPAPPEVLAGFDKPNLGPLRVLNVLLLLQLGARLLARYPRDARQPFLALLGTHSLEVCFLCAQKMKAGRPLHND